MSGFVERTISVLMILLFNINGSNVAFFPQKDTSDLVLSGTNTEIAALSQKNTDNYKYLKTASHSFNEGFFNKESFTVMQGFVTPEMFGAKGDGVCDDSAALQLAINAGKPVLLGQKTYLCSNVILKDNTIITGTKESVLKFSKPEKCISGENIEGVTIENIKLTFANGGVENQIWGQILFQNSRDIQITNCAIAGSGYRNITLIDCEMIYITNNTFIDVMGNALCFNGVKEALVTNNIVTAETQVKGFHLFDCYAKSRDAENIIYQNNVFQGYTSNGIQITGTPGVTSAKNVEISGCTFENFGDAGIKIDGIDNLIIIEDCTITNGGPKSYGFKTGLGYAIITGGGSGEAKNITVKDCLIANVGYGFTHATTSQTVENYTIIGNRFERVSRPMRFSICSYNCICIENNIIQDADEIFITEMSIPDGVTVGIISLFILKNNTIIGGNNFLVLIPNAILCFITDNLFINVESYNTIGLRVSGSEEVVIQRNTATNEGLNISVIGEVSILRYDRNYAGGTTVIPNTRNAEIEMEVCGDRVSVQESGVLPAPGILSIDLRQKINGLQIAILTIYRGPNVYCYLLNSSVVAPIYTDTSENVDVLLDNNYLIIENSSGIEYRYSIVPLG